jgi:hypothetical protein
MDQEIFLARVDGPKPPSLDLNTRNRQSDERGWAAGRRKIADRRSRSIRVYAPNLLASGIGHIDIAVCAARGVYGNSIGVAKLSNRRSLEVGRPMRRGSMTGYGTDCGIAAGTDPPGGAQALRRAAQKIGASFRRVDETLCTGFSKADRDGD